MTEGEDAFEKERQLLIQTSGQEITAEDYVRRRFMMEFAEAKKKLGQDILKMIQEFEKRYGVVLTNTGSERAPMAMDDRLPRTMSFWIDFGC